ncbi:hypothetical protein ACQKWADRAFT_331353 [Trichoderma austrokoningii]
MDEKLVLARETQVVTAQGQTELSSPSSDNSIASQQVAREDFVERQERRLYKLINQGHLCIGSRSLIWVDENGLLTAHNMSSTYSLNRMPFFYAGPDADVNEISKSPKVSHHCWGQEDFGDEELVSGSLLEKLVMKEMISLPATTHSTWKNLRASLESSTATPKPTSVMFKMLTEAITEEKDDWNQVNYFVKNCNDQKKSFDIDLDAFSRSLYRTAGVDPDQGKPWTALRAINEELADEIFTFCHLANRAQSKELSLEQLPLLRELADGVLETFLCDDMMDKMKRLFKFVEAKALGRG